MRASGLSKFNIHSSEVRILRNIWPLVVFCILYSMFGILTSPALADEYHYNNILIGERAAGMGGAYTAVSDDPTGLYYNPAGIAFAPGRSFSASVNAYQYSRKTYKDVLGGNGWDRISSNLLPNYFGVIQPLGKGKVGFSYAVPDSRQENQAQTFNDIPGTTISSYVINMNDSDYTYNFGPSYAVKLNDDLSVGTTVYMHYRERQFISNQFIRTNTADYDWNNVYNSTSESGVKPILGIMWAPKDKISLGLTVSKTVIFNSNIRLQRTYRSLGSANDIPLYNVWESRDNKEFPLTISMGAAYFPSESLLISADITHYGDASYNLTFKEQTGTGGTSTSSNPQSTTINAAVGAEYYLSPRVALRGGLFTNMANTPELTTGNADEPEHIDMYGTSLSISHFTRSSSLTFGGSYSYGTGKSHIFGDTSIQDVEMQNITAFLSAAFSY